MQTIHTKFSTLSLSHAMLQNLERIGYNEMTPIQAAALPSVLLGKDIIAQAKTGSGKTATFGIGLLSRLDVKKFRVQSLILCPTRELADQVAKELRMLAKFAHNIKILTLCGGAAFGPQYGSLQHGAHIVVGTPGRVLKHLQKNSLNLENLETLVLDEADRMLDMGFIEEIEAVLAFAPKERQSLLFSATYTDEVLAISRTIQNDPVSIRIAEEESKNKILERFYETDDKFATLLKILSTYKPKNAIVFTNTKAEADVLAQEMQGHAIDALALHGDLEQYDRNDVLVQFANKSCRVLVATDVAARGLDIKELAMVVNYDLPHTQETYTHRIGRTARAGEEGLAMSLYTSYEAQNAEEFAGGEREFLEDSSLACERDFSMLSEYITLVIEGGKKEKLRAGDILGALTGEGGLSGSEIGKIDIYERQSYAAIQSSKIDDAYDRLKHGKIKGKKFSIWIL